MLDSRHLLSIWESLLKVDKFRAFWERGSAALWYQGTLGKRSCLAVKIDLRNEVPATKKYRLHQYGDCS